MGIPMWISMVERQRVMEKIQKEMEPRVQKNFYRLLTQVPAEELRRDFGAEELNDMTLGLMNERIKDHVDRAYRTFESSLPGKTMEDFLWTVTYSVPRDSREYRLMRGKTRRPVELDSVSISKWPPVLDQLELGIADLCLFRPTLVESEDLIRQHLEQDRSTV